MFPHIWTNRNNQIRERKKTKKTNLRYLLYRSEKRFFFDVFSLFWNLFKKFFLFEKLWRKNQTKDLCCFLLIFYICFGSKKKQKSSLIARKRAGAGESSPWYTNMIRWICSSFWNNVSTIFEQNRHFFRTFVWICFIQNIFSFVFRLFALIVFTFTKILLCLWLYTTPTLIDEPSNRLSFVFVAKFIQFQNLVIFCQFNFFMLNFSLLPFSSVWV